MLIRAYVFNGTIRVWQIVIPNFGIVQGLFQINSFDLVGHHDGEITFDITLDSAGEITFAAI